MEVVSPNCSVLSDRSSHAAHARPGSSFFPVFLSLFLFLSSSLLSVLFVLAFLPSFHFLFLFVSCLGSCLAFRLSREQNASVFVIAIYWNNTWGGEDKGEREEGGERKVGEMIALRDNAGRRCFVRV